MLDASGINDVDATGAEMLNEVIDELREKGVNLHLADVKGPVRDVLRRSGAWGHTDIDVHASTAEAIIAINKGGRFGTSDRRGAGIDETATEDRPDSSRTESTHV